MANSRRLTRDDVVTNAKLMGVPPDLALAIWQQESSSGANTKISPKGAVGGFQVIPATFNKVYPGGDINDPVDNMIAGLKVMREGLDKSGGDKEKAAQYYYSGRFLKPGEEGPNSGLGTPSVRQYGQQVMAKASPSLQQPPDVADVIGQQFATEDDEDETEDQYYWRPDDEEEEQPSVPPGYRSYTADMGPYEGGFGGSEAAFASGQRDYDFDRYIRQLVDEELKA